MAKKAKIKGESNTTGKIKELTGVKPEKVTEKQLETRKHQTLHILAGVNDELALIQEELKKDYGTNDINIQDGMINYPENGEVNKED